MEICRLSFSRLFNNPFSLSQILFNAGSSETIVKNSNNSEYTGILNTPTTKATNTVALDNVIYAASFGSPGERINFIDTNNNSVDAIIRIPAP